MRKFIFTFTAVLISAISFAQTNIQIQYDFGSDRKQVTTTVEGFYNDNWGNTFFFIDHDFPVQKSSNKSISGTYWEIARCLNFWQGSKLKDLSLQVEYNGGVYRQYNINHAFLGGLDYFFHSEDYTKTCNIKVLYKGILYDDKSVHSKLPMQFTFVWGLYDIFGVEGLTFSGFADFWWEEHMVCKGFGKDGPINPRTSHNVFLAEPQLWYCIGQHFGCDNLNIGGEVELSNDFGTTKGFKARPCLGVKWQF